MTRAIALTIAVTLCANILWEITRDPDFAQCERVSSFEDCFSQVNP